MRNRRKRLICLIDVAELLGLNKIDLENAREYIEYDELEIAFHIVVTQMYEYDIEINDEFFSLICLIGREMSIHEDEYIFANRLVRAGVQIPEPIKRELSKTIGAR